MNNPLPTEIVLATTENGGYLIRDPNQDGYYAIYHLGKVEQSGIDPNKARKIAYHSPNVTEVGKVVFRL